VAGCTNNKAHVCNKENQGQLQETATFYADVMRAKNTQFDAHRADGRDPSRKPARSARVKRHSLVGRGMGDIVDRRQSRMQPFRRYPHQMSTMFFSDDRAFRKFIVWASLQRM
jgi:hypothetical protein